MRDVGKSNEDLQGLEHKACNSKRLPGRAVLFFVSSMSRFFLALVLTFALASGGFFPLFS